MACFHVHNKQIIYGTHAHRTQFLVKQLYFPLIRFYTDFTTILTEISLYAACTLTNWMNERNGNGKWIMIECGMVFIYVNANCTNQINTSCVCVLIMLLVNCINRFWCFQFIGTYITRTRTHTHLQHVSFCVNQFCWFTPVNFITLFDDHWIRYEWSSITTIIITWKVVKFRAIEVIHQRIETIHWC